MEVQEIRECPVETKRGREIRLKEEIVGVASRQTGRGEE